MLTFLKRLSFLCLTLLLVISCDMFGPKEASLHMIPKDSFVVCALNLSSIKEKGNLAEIDQLKAFSLLLEEAGDESKVLEKVLKTPAEAGVNLENNVYLFVRGEEGSIYDMVVHFVGDLDDEAKFTGCIENIFSDFSSSDFEVKECEGYKFCYLDGLVIAWNKKQFLILVSGNSTGPFMHMEDPFNLEKSMKLCNDASFMSSIEEMNDLLFWVDVASLPEGFKKDLTREFGLMKKPEDFIGKAACNISFESNGIRTRTQGFYTEEQAKKYEAIFASKVNFNKSLLKYLPKENKALMSYVVDPLAQFELFKDDSNVSMINELAKGATQMSLSDMIATLGGSVLVGLHDLEEQSYTHNSWVYDEETDDYVQKEVEDKFFFPNVSLLLDLKDKKVFSTLLGLIPEGAIYTEESYYWLPVPNLDERYVYLSLKEEALLLTTSKTILDGFISGEGLKENLAESKQGKDVRDNLAYGFVDLDIENYPDYLKEMILNNMSGSDEHWAMKHLSILEHFEFKQKDWNGQETFLAVEDLDVNVIEYVIKSVDSFVIDTFN